MMDELPDAFNDAAKVTRSHIPAMNTPARLQMIDKVASVQPPRAKRGRPMGAKDSQPRQRRATHEQVSEMTIQPEVSSLLIPIQPPANEEISISYISTGTIWNRHEIMLDEQFAYFISQDINDMPPDPKSIKEAQESPDWLEWEKAINSELDSLINRNVFGPIISAPSNTHLTGYRWTFVKKKNAQGKVVRYKARLVAKGYTQIPGRDFDLTYARLWML
ncbi:unnamed protein product [Calypogeia fissa]